MMNKYIDPITDLYMSSTYWCLIKMAEFLHTPSWNILSWMENFCSFKQISFKLFKSLMNNKFGQWLGTIRQQTITWGNVVLHLCHNMMSIGQNIITHYCLLKSSTILRKIHDGWLQYNLQIHWIFIQDCFFLCNFSWISIESFNVNLFCILCHIWHW